MTEGTGILKIKQQTLRAIRQTPKQKDGLPWNSYNPAFLEGGH